MEAAFQLILETSLYGAVVGLVILLAKQLLGQRLSGKWHYLLWTVLLVKLLFPFGPESAISLFNVVPEVPATLTIGTTPPATPVPIISPGEVVNRAPAAPPQGLPSQPESPAALSNIVPVVWLGGVLALTAWLLLSSQLFKHKLRNSHSITDQRVAAVLGRAKDKMGVNANIRLLISDLVDTPSLFGLFNPRILLPKSACDLSEQELEYILLHELAHYKRKDVHVNCLLLALQAVHWFNPVMWYLFRRIRQDMELATDEMVLASLESTEHKAYGRALLNVLERFAEPKLSGRLLYMADDRKSIARRIRMIAMAGPLRTRKRAVFAAGLLCVVVLGAVLLTTGVSRGNSSIDDESILVFPGGWPIPLEGAEPWLVFSEATEINVFRRAIENSTKLDVSVPAGGPHYRLRVPRILPLAMYLHSNLGVYPDEHDGKVNMHLYFNKDSGVISYSAAITTHYVLTPEDTLALKELFGVLAEARAHVELHKFFREPYPFTVEDWGNLSAAENVGVVLGYKDVYKLTRPAGAAVNEIVYFTYVDGAPELLVGLNASHAWEVDLDGSGVINIVYTFGSPGPHVRIVGMGYAVVEPVIPHTLNLQSKLLEADLNEVFGVPSVEFIPGSKQFVVSEVFDDAATVYEFAPHHRSIWPQSWTLRMLPQRVRQ